MPHDPQLAADICIYMEAASGDDGVHDSNGVWWLSPDVELMGATSGPDKADPGADNTVDVTLHSHGGGNGNCTISPGTESITIELWVANPSLVMAPDNAASTAHLDSIGVPLVGLDTGTTHQFTWRPATGLPASDPASPGHKCLIARCYPDPLTPSSNSFFAPDDPHVAQHNICVVPCGGPGAARRPSTCGFQVATLNPNAFKPQKVLVRAVLDLDPDKFVRDVVLPRLKRTPGFERLARKPPKSFTCQFPDSLKTKVAGKAKPVGTKRMPTSETEVALEPGQFVTFTFKADLSGATFGDAYIFHLTQHEAERAQGGLTIVMLAG